MIYKDSTKFGYKPGDIRKCIRTSDFISFDLDDINLEDETKQIASNFIKSNCSTLNINKNNLRGKPVFTTDSLYDALTVRRTDYILKRVLTYPHFSREDEVRQIINILKSEKEAVVFRTDIADFFESISFSKTISALKKAGFSNQTTLIHLAQISKQVKKMGCAGLPRGLSISTTLSEFNMISFDRAMIISPHCIYYCRYVDDIIAIYSNPNFNAKNLVEELLPPGLELNDDKTTLIRLNTEKDIEFLGYSISMNKPFTTKVAKNKIDRTKKRIVLSFNKYLKDHDFKLLFDRLSFLASNTRLKIVDREKPITAGFRYQYSLSDEEGILPQLKELDTFYRRILLSNRYSLSKKVRNSMSDIQHNRLFRVSFVSGYKNFILQKYSRIRISKVKTAWYYE